LFKGVIFDMDGLMLDTEKLFARFWCKAAADFGTDMRLDHVIQIQSMSGKEAKARFKEMFGPDFNYEGVRLRRIELMTAFINANGVEKKKGLDELLAYLKKEGYKLAVATATESGRAQKYLEQVGVFHYFDALVCSAMVAKGKPEPDIYLKAANAIGVSPEECIVLEDSCNGVLSAYRAGCKPIMIPDLSQPSEYILSLLYDKTDDLNGVIDILKKEHKSHRI